MRSSTLSSSSAARGGSPVPGGRDVCSPLWGVDVVGRLLGLVFPLKTKGNAVRFAFPFIDRRGQQLEDSTSPLPSCLLLRVLGRAFAQQLHL